MKDVINENMENAIDHKRITIDIFLLEDGGAQPVVRCEDGTEFEHKMIAAEYLAYICATESGAGFEKALELLNKGAVTYRHLERPPK